MTGREQIPFSDRPPRRWQGPLRSPFSQEMVITVWIDGYDPARSMPPKIRRKVYYIEDGRVEMISQPNEVMLIKVPRWFVEEHGLVILDE